MKKSTIIGQVSMLAITYYELTGIPVKKLEPVSRPKMKHCAVCGCYSYSRICPECQDELKGV